MSTNAIGCHGHPQNSPVLQVAEHELSYEWLIKEDQDKAGSYSEAAEHAMCINQQCQNTRSGLCFGHTHCTPTLAKPPAHFWTRDFFVSPKIHAVFPRLDRTHTFLQGFYSCMYYTRECISRVSASNSIQCKPASVASLQTQIDVGIVTMIYHPLHRSINHELNQVEQRREACMGIRIDFKLRETYLK